MKDLMPFDEMNTLEEYIRVLGKRQAENGTRPSAQDIEDEIEDLLITAYLMGYDQLEEDTGLKEDIDSSDMFGSVNREVAGKTWKERLSEYTQGEELQVGAIVRVIETETHRVFNESIMESATKAAKNGAKLNKTWRTMQDDRVRDTHIDLESVTIPLDERFNTVDGDSALQPGGFSLPENNANCRCRIAITQVSG